MNDQRNLDTDSNQVPSCKPVKLLGIHMITNYHLMSTFPHYAK